MNNKIEMNIESVNEMNNESKTGKISIFRKFRLGCAYYTILSTAVCVIALIIHAVGKKNWIADIEPLLVGMVIAGYAATFIAAPLETLTFTFNRIIHRAKKSKPIASSDDLDLCEPEEAAVTGALSAGCSIGEAIVTFLFSTLVLLIAPCFIALRKVWKDPRFKGEKKGDYRVMGGYETMDNED